MFNTNNSNNANPNTSQNNLFGAQNQPTPFNQTNTNQNQSSTGASLFGQTTKPSSNQITGGLFGNSANVQSSSNSNPTSSFFGNTKPIFSGKAKEQPAQNSNPSGLFNFGTSPNLQSTPKTDLGPPNAQNQSTFIGLTQNPAFVTEQKSNSFLGPHQSNANLPPSGSQKPETEENKNSITFNQAPQLQNNNLLNQTQQPQTQENFKTGNFINADNMKAQANTMSGFFQNIQPQKINSPTKTQEQNKPSEPKISATNSLLPNIPVKSSANLFEGGISQDKQPPTTNIPQPQPQFLQPQNTQPQNQNQHANSNIQNLEIKVSNIENQAQVNPVSTPSFHQSGNQLLFNNTASEKETKPQSAISQDDAQGKKTSGVQIDNSNKNKNFFDQKEKTPNIQSQPLINKNNEAEQQNGNAEKGLNQNYPLLDGLKSKINEDLHSREPKGKSDHSVLTENLQLRYCEQSNQYLLDILKNESSIGGREILEILESRQINEKLMKVMGYFKTRDEESHFKRNYDEGRIKWNNKIPLNNISKELISLISDQTSLGMRHSFNLLDSYFRNDTRSFSIIINYQDNMPNEQKAQVGRVADKINTKIKVQISKERIRLIQVIYRLLCLTFIPAMEHSEKDSITHFMKSFLKKNDYLSILWNNYIELCATPLPDNFGSYEEMNLWIENTLHEEFMLLKCVFILCRFKNIPAEFNYEILKNFYNQSFQGSFQFHSNQKNLKIQDYYQNQVKLAQNITDVSILILLANMSLDTVDSTINASDINTSSAPYSLFYKTGKELFNFFQQAKDLQEISLIFMAFRSLIIEFNLLQKNAKFNEIPKYLYDYDMNALLKFENVNYLSFVRDMLRHEIFKDSDDFLVVLEFRLIIKGWVNLLGITLNDNEIYQNYNLYTDILYYCLNDPYLVNIFWEEDFKKRRDLSAFINKLMSFFPLKSNKFIKLLSALIGKNNYSVVNIIKILGDMSTFTTEAREIDAETVFTLNEAHNPEIFKSLEDVVLNEINIPKGTQYRVIYKFIDGEEIPLVFQWNFEYNYWNRIFSEWTITLNTLTENPLENIDINLSSCIKLICKALVADPRVLFMLEQYLTQRKVKSSVYPHGVTLILLLIDSLFYFQRLKHPTFTLFSHIISALNALISYEERNYKKIVCFMIQLHPLTVFNVEKNRPFDIIEHPFFEVVSLIKRYDYTVEHNTKKYNLLLQLLNFCYEIFKNNEFPLDLFPDENFVKFSYYSIGNNESKIQDLAYKIQELHQVEQEWNVEKLDVLNKYTESLINCQIKSTFLDDFLKTIYQYILLNYDRFLFLPNELIKKFQIGNYLFKITRLLLNKLSINIERINIYMTQNAENPLLKMIVKHLNATNFQDFILNTLEVHTKLESIENFDEKESSSCLENKNWAIYIQNSQNELDYSLRMSLRNMLASCLSTLESIIDLIEIYNENKSINSEHSNLEINNIELIDYFYKIFSNKQEMFCYQQNFISQNSSKQISINLVLAISTLINFEGYKDLKVINESLNNIDSFLPIQFNEMELETSQSFFYSADFSLGQNILLNGKTKSNLFQDSVSTLSLRILSKLLLFWEGILSTKRPFLNELLISISLQSETGISFNYILYREMIKILFNHGGQIDDAVAVLELLLICLHSQKGFLDPFLKDASVLSNIPNKIKLNEKFQDFCEKVVMNQNPEKMNKQFLFHFLLLICEIFKKEESCKIFVSKLRNKMSFFQDLTTTIFSAFKADSNYMKSVNDLISSSKNIPVDQQMKIPQNQYNRLKMEYDIINGLSNNYMILTVIQFICNEMLKQPKNVSLSLSQTFNKQFMNWLTYYSFNKSKKLKPYFKTGLDYFLDELANTKNLILPTSEEKNSQYSRHDISSYRTIYLKTVQPRKRIISQNEQNGIILDKGIYKILNSNGYGYGKNFLFDTQEIFYALKMCNYRNDFVYKFTVEMQSYNLFNSIMDVEFKCLEGWVRLFGFISSLGEEGVASSTMIYDTSIPLKQRQLNELFRNQKEISIINPNYNFLLEKGGFITIFSENESEPEQNCWKFLKSVVKYVVNEFYNEKCDYKKDDIFRRYLNQHVNLMINVFSCLHYISNKQNLEKTNLNYFWDLKSQTLNFSQNVLRNILQYPQFTEVNITSFITFFFYFLSFLDSFELNQQEDNQPDKISVESLLELLKRNLDCYPLVVYCLILLMKKNHIGYINYFYKEGKILVEHIIEKLSHSDATYQESIANIKFLIEVCQSEKGSLLLKELGLINELCQNQLFKGQIDEYNEENRNNNHILWCWVLVLYRVFSKGLIKSPGDMNSALFFIKTYLSRIEKVLAIPLIISKDAKNSKLFSANIKVALNGNYKYSLAYLEELDYTLQLLSVFFLDSKQWKEINKNQFDKLVFLMSICTIKLFRANFSYTENYAPQTRYEKRMNEMFGMEKSGSIETKVFKGIQPNDIVTSTATPMKMGINQKIMDMHEQMKPSSKEIMSTLTQYYNPSLYIFKIEINYQNILLSLLFNLTQAFPYSDLCQYFEEQVYSDVSGPNKNPKYDNSYWEFFAESINDCQIYKRQTAQKWIAHEDSLRKALRKLEAVRNSVETGINYGSLNTLEKIPDFELLIKYSITALIMSFEVAALHFEIFLEYKKLWNVLIGDIIKMYKDRTTQNIEESEKLLLKHIVKYGEEIPNFSIVNFSVEGSIEKKWEDISDSDEGDNKENDKDIEEKKSDKDEIDENNEAKTLDTGSPIKKINQPFNNQPKDEMMEKLMSLDRKTFFINLFNIDNSATKEDISKFYEGVKILNILKNTGKQGNYDLLFESKEEAAKLISRGPGKINNRLFFMRNSYRNLLQEKNENETKLKQTISEQIVLNTEEEKNSPIPNFYKPEIKYIKSNYYQKNFDLEQSGSGSKLKNPSRYDKDKKQEYSSKFNSKKVGGPGANSYNKNLVKEYHYKKDQTNYNEEGYDQYHMPAKQNLETQFSELSFNGKNVSTQDQPYVNSATRKKIPKNRFDILNNI